MTTAVEPAVLFDVTIGFLGANDGVAFEVIHAGDKHSTEEDNKEV